MAELDEIVQKILLDGDVEVINKFAEIGSEGVKTFQELSEALEQTNGKMEAVAGAVAGLATAFVGLAGSVLAYVEANDEAIQKTNFLAESMGTTTKEINGLEAAFAAAGVGVKTFEQFATRLTTTIARDWPEIAANIRTAATQAVESQNSIAAATQRVQDAQRNLLFQGDQASSALAAANLRVEQSYLALQAGAEKALAVIRNNFLSVQSAALGLESAEQRLAELEGKPVSDADKKALELKEAQLAVDKAREAQVAALQKQEQDRREAATKAAQLEQALSDARLKRDILIQEQTNARAKAELQLQEAVAARAKAEEAASQQQLKSIPAIVDAIKAIENGAKGAASAIDLSQVSVKHLVDGIIAAAAAGDKLPPTGMKTLTELMKVLNADTDHLIDRQQRLAIVQQLSTTGFRNAGISAAELLSALEKGPKFFDDFSKAAEKAFFTTDEAKHNVSEFRDEMERLGFAIDIVNRNFAAAASPTFTKFLEEIRESLTSATGTLNLFVKGIGAIGTAIGFLIEQVQTFAESIDKAFGLEKGRTMQVLIGSLIILVAAFGAAWAAIPATIAVVITALGYVASKLDAIKAFYEDHKAAITGVAVAVGVLLAAFAPITAILVAIGSAIIAIALNWDKVKAAFLSWVDEVKKSPLVKFFSDLIENAKKLAGLLHLTNNPNTDKGPSTGANSTTNASEGSEGGNTQNFASGGHVTGPGTGTSDSIPARLSNGEFVVKSAAVSAFGLDFLHAVNNMRMPMFASGGLVGSPARLAGGGSTAPAQSALNLTIDGQTFRGLKGPANVVSDLSDFAVSRQASSAGRKPSWVR